MARAVSTLAVAMLLAAPAAAQGGWRRASFECERAETGCEAPSCCQRGVLVEKREQRGSALREVRATGVIDAPPAAVFAVVTAFEKQKGLAYIEDVRILTRTADEVIFWAQANFPMVAPRDWVVRARLQPDSIRGRFRVTWAVADVPEAPPPAPGVVRLRVNSGEWRLEPASGSRTRARYYMVIDPGGHVPIWLGNLLLTVTLPKTFRAVRGEAEKSTHPEE